MTPAAVEAVARPASAPAHNPGLLLERRAFYVAFLTKYQDEAYARRYQEVVARVEKADRFDPDLGLTDAVARNLFKLMAYKDEYEVARLYTEGAFREKLTQQFEGKYKLKIHLAPPLLARRDLRTAHLKKRAFGPWIFTAFRLMARFKHLRGTSFDLFGYTSERCMERRLIADYIAQVDESLSRLNPSNYSTVVELASCRK